MTSVIETNANYNKQQFKATKQTYIPEIRILPSECRSASCHFHMHNFHWLGSFISGVSMRKSTNFVLWSRVDIVSLSPNENAAAKNTQL